MAATHFHTSVSDSDGQTCGIVAHYEDVAVWFTGVRQQLGTVGYKVISRRQNAKSYRAATLSNPLVGEHTRFTMQARICDSGACPPATHERT